jgi:hypothetical protein
MRFAQLAMAAAKVSGKAPLASTAKAQVVNLAKTINKKKEPR